MNETACEAILHEWGPGGGLKRCLAGEDVPAFPLPPPERIVVWNGPTAIRRPWSAAEDAVMRDLYKVEGYGVLRKLPLRSKDAVRTRARILGVQAATCVRRT